MIPKTVALNREAEKENRVWLVLFLVFTLFSVVLIKLNLSYLGTIDDPYLREFLYNGENRTLIMSYPLSSVLVYLYGHFPQVQWLSWTFFLYMEAAIALYAYYISRMENRGIRISMILFGFVVLLFAWMNITITLLTLLLIVLAMPLVKRHQIAFWAFFLFASLLRDTIVLSVLPLLAVGYAMFFDRKYFTKKRFVAVSFLVLAVAANIYSPKLDGAYQNWLDFYHARVYFTDLHGKDEKGIMSESENLIANSWYAQDESLLPSKKIMAAAGSELDVVVYRLTHMKLRHVLSELYHHKILLILLLVTFYLLFYAQMSRRKKVLYVVYIIGFFTLLFIRDVNRVTYPLIFLWMIFLVNDLLKLGKTKEIYAMFFAATVALIIDLPIYNRMHQPKALEHEHELVELMKKHDYMYEPGLGFPVKVNSAFVDALSQNRMFDEENWISNYILPAGWMSRHPFFYRSHNIGKGSGGKYAAYYDYLISAESAFVGSKDMDEEMNAKILDMYDKLYGENGRCHHEVVLVDESKNFSLVKVKRVCSLK